MIHYLSQNLIVPKKGHKVPMNWIFEMMYCDF